MLTLTADGLIVGDVPVEDEELTSLVHGQANRISETFEEFRRELDSIESDRRLTDEGKIAARSRLVEDWKPKLRNALNLDAIERLSKQIEGTRRNMHVHSNRLEWDEDVNEEVARQQVLETRELLRSKLAEEGGALEVERIAAKAAAEDDVVTLRAIEYAPPAFPLLPEEKLARVRETHSRVHFPDHAAELEEKQATLGRLQHNAMAAREQIKELTGEDPVHTPEFQVLTADHTLEPYEPEAEGEPETEPEGEPEPVPAT